MHLGPLSLTRGSTDIILCYCGSIQNSRCDGSYTEISKISQCQAQLSQVMDRLVLETIVLLNVFRISSHLLFSHRISLNCIHFSLLQFVVLLHGFHFMLVLNLFRRLHHCRDIARGSWCMGFS
jgi:hypothetical protein